MADDALYLVDGSGFIFRAYHALPPLTTRAGVPSGAVYGFTTMLIKLELDHRPSHLAVIFDAGAVSFRNAMYDAYKANRTEPPDDLKPQFPAVRRVVEAFGIPIVEAKNFEADDLIATFVAQAKARGLRVVIVSSDKDLMQLVDDRCAMLDTMKDVVYGPAEVEEKFGVPPAQLGDVLALMGDHVDNVPGVPGVGPKTASALIKEFGSLDAVLDRIDDVAAMKGLRGAASVAAKLKAHVEQARLSRKLVALDEHVPSGIELESFRRKEPDMTKIETILREFEFTRLIDRLKPSSGKAGAKPSEPAPVEASPVQQEILKVAVVQTAVKIGATPPRIIVDAATLTAFAGELSRRHVIGVAVEATGGTAVQAALIGIAFALEGASPAYVPLGHRYLGAPAQLDAEAVFAILGPLLGAERPRKHVHGVTDAEVLLARRGVPLRGIASDPGIASYLLDPTVEHELKPLCEARFGARIDDRAALCGTGKKATSFEALEVARAAAFAACEAEATLELGTQLRRELETRGLV
jgi:DNA polymerase-1